MSFVLDASVSLAWMLGDERAADADVVLDRFPADQAVVPALWISETANGLLTAVRRRRIKQEDAALAVELLDGLPIEVIPQSRDSLPRIYRLGADLGLTAYDATYLDLALTLKLPLATLDDDLRRAARTRRVRLVPGRGAG